MDILNLLTGAILGAILGYLFPIWYGKARNRMQTRRIENRQSFLESKQLYEWLIEYYRKIGKLNDLYDCKIGNFEIKIPFLTKKEWHYSMPINPDLDDILQYTETDNKRFTVDSKLIERRKALGQTIFNEPTLYLDRIDDSYMALKLHVKSCDYLEVITSLAHLEEETFRAVKTWRFKNLTIRDSYFNSLSKAEKLLMRPYSIGCVVVLVIKTENGYELIVQTRSHSTVTFGGSKAVIPTFGLSPIIGKTKEANLLFYNFIKEFCEELFSYDELINLMSSKRAHPYWFYDLPEASKFPSLLKQKLFSFEFTGFGFDALNGTATIALLAHISDVEYGAELKKNIIANWEVAERTIYLEPIEFVELKSSKLEDWLRKNQYHYGAAFAIERAINRLEKMTA